MMKFSVLNSIKLVDLINFPTLKEFYYDSSKTQLETKILYYSKDEIDGKLEVCFEKTIFHPQGGGQPSDNGYIIVNSNKINVFSLTYDREKGIIKHKLNLTDEKLLNNQDNAWLYINAEKRLLYSRLHTAGHLIDIAISKLRFNLKPGKGFHFPESPYVEYEGKIEEDRSKKEGSIFSTIIEVLKKTSNDLILSAEKDNIVISTIYSFEQAKKDILLPNYLPEGKDVRWVNLLKNDPGCPCGGTHLRHISEIGKMEITKIVKKSKKIRIYYNLQ